MTPTPIVAYAGRKHDAIASIVVTASHNPPQDNGYKVFDANGAQIIPPVDVMIAAAIDRVGAANEVPRIENVMADGHLLAEPIEWHIFDEYWAEVAEGRFGASMQVSLCNDGPVTLIIDREAAS